MIEVIGFTVNLRVAKMQRSHLQLGVSHHCSWLNCSFGGRVMSHRVLLNAIFRFMDGQGKQRNTVELCGWFHKNKRLGCSSSFCLGLQTLLVWTGEVWMFTSGLGGLCQHCFGQFFGSGGAFRWWVSMGYMGLNAPIRFEMNGLRHILEGKDVLVLELWQFRVHLK